MIFFRGRGGKTAAALAQKPRQVVPSAAVAENDNPRHVCGTLVEDGCRDPCGPPGIGDWYCPVCEWYYNTHGSHPDVPLLEVYKNAPYARTDTCEDRRGPRVAVLMSRVCTPQRVGGCVA